MNMQSEKGVYARIFCAQNALNTGSRSIGNGGWGVSDPSYQKGNPSGMHTTGGVGWVLPTDLVGFASVGCGRKWDDGFNGRRIIYEKETRKKQGVMGLEESRG